MGYDVHVTRKREWGDPDGPAITQEERDKLRMAQPDLDELVRLEAGELVTKNPDDALIARLVAIAADLQAKVQGDDGEEYTAESLNEDAKRRAKSSWIGWLRPIIIFGVLWFAAVWLVLWLAGY